MGVHKELGVHFTRAGQNVELESLRNGVNIDYDQQTQTASYK